MAVNGREELAVRYDWRASSALRLGEISPCLSNVLWLLQHLFRVTCKLNQKREPWEFQGGGPGICCWRAAWANPLSVEGAVAVVGKQRRGAAGPSSSQAHWNGRPRGPKRHL